MKKVFFILILATLLYGCENELANTAVSQDEKITKFIESKYAESKVVFNNGVNRIVLEEGDGSCFAAPGDLVDFTYVGYPFSGSIGSPFTRGDMQAHLSRDEMISGLVYGMEGMCPGEKAYIIFSCKYGYDKPVAGVGRDQALVFEVFMNDIDQE